MITRRTVTLGLALLAVPGLAQAQNIRRGAMEEIFERLSYDQRTRIQRKLAAAKVYDLGIDGLYGPGTEGGLIRGANFLNGKANAVIVDLSTKKGIGNYYRGILNGSFDKYIYR